MFSNPSITDSLNDTKDKVKYLESLKRPFDQLYQDANPANIINNAIPGLVNSIKQMDSISRYYARTGFLGILLTKVNGISTLWLCFFLICIFPYPQQHFFLYCSGFCYFFVSFLLEVCQNIVHTQSALFHSLGFNLLD